MRKKYIGNIVCITAAHWHRSNKQLLEREIGLEKNQIEVFCIR